MQTTQNDNQNLLSVPAAAKRLGVNRSTIYQMTYRGELPTVRVRRAVRIDPRDLETFIRISKQRNKTASTLESVLTKH